VMNTNLSPPFRRALAVLVLVLVLWFGWTALLAPLLSLTSDRESDITALADQLAHLRAVITRKPALDQRTSTVDKALAAIGSFWTGPSLTAVSAGIQSTLRPAIEAGGGQLRSTSDAGEANEHGFRRVSVRFNIEGTVETMQRTLLAVETAKPSLFVESLIVMAPEISASRDRPPLLTVDLTVAGYMRPDAGSAKGSHT